MTVLINVTLNMSEIIFILHITCFVKKLKKYSLIQKYYC